MSRNIGSRYFVNLVITSKRDEVTYPESSFIRSLTLRSGRLRSLLHGRATNKTGLPDLSPIPTRLLPTCRKDGSPLESWYGRGELLVTCLRFSLPSEGVLGETQCRLPFPLTDYRTFSDGTLVPDL